MVRRSDGSVDWRTGYRRLPGESISEYLDRKSTPVPFSGCKIWIGGVDSNGYGRVIIDGHFLAHRLSWFIKHGPIPDGLNVLHRCDVPACIEPSHLFLGTQADNIKDMVSKKRNRTASFENQFFVKHPEKIMKGEKHPRSILKNEDVISIRASTDSYIDLSKKYGVKPATIKDIKQRRSWRHIP